MAWGGLVQADNCLTITNTNQTAQLSPVDNFDCTSVWGLLKNSGKFTDLKFPSNSSSTSDFYPGFCYVSNRDIPAKLITTSGQSIPVNVESYSAWTSEFKPSLLQNYGYPMTFVDNMATVITEWVVKNNKNKILGTVFTRDSVDLNLGSEQDIIVAGAGYFVGAKGAVRVNTSPEIMPDAQGNPVATGNLNITGIYGKMCLPS